MNNTTMNKEEIDAANRIIVSQFADYLNEVGGKGGHIGEGPDDKALLAALKEYLPELDTEPFRRLFLIFAAGVGKGLTISRIIDDMGN